jgi:hypothetical protein
VARRRSRRKWCGAGPRSPGGRPVRRRKLRPDWRRGRSRTRRLGWQRLERSWGRTCLQRIQYRDRSRRECLRCRHEHHRASLAPTRHTLGRQRLDAAW